MIPIVHVLVLACLLGTSIAGPKVDAIIMNDLQQILGIGNYLLYNKLPINMYIGKVLEVKEVISVPFADAPVTIEAWVQEIDGFNNLAFGVNSFHLETTPSSLSIKTNASAGFGNSECGFVGRAHVSTKLKGEDVEIDIVIRVNASNVGGSANLTFGIGVEANGHLEEPTVNIQSLHVSEFHVPVNGISLDPKVDGHQSELLNKLLNDTSDQLVNTILQLFEKPILAEIDSMGVTLINKELSKLAPRMYVFMFSLVKEWVENQNSAA